MAMHFAASDPMPAQENTMPVDMLVSRFFEELKVAIPSNDRPFCREGRADHDIRSAQLPPYRHVFHGLCLIGHSRGYRLPRYAAFRDNYLKALRAHPRYEDVCSCLFDDSDNPHPGLLYRIGGWYLDGLTHTHLYCALVQAFEEQRRIGAVVMDARVDVKLKADLLVVTPSRVARVSMEAGTGPKQDKMIARRAAAEFDAKRYNRTSSQEGNPLHEEVFTAAIAHGATELLADFGVPLFKGDAIDNLIRQLDDSLAVPTSMAVTYEQMKHVTMRSLRDRQNRGDIPRWSLLDTQA